MLYFNGVEIPTSSDIRFNGMSFNEVRYNGLTFWKKGDDIGTPPIPNFCDASEGTFEGMIRIQWGYSNYNAGYIVWRSDDDGTTFNEIAQVVNGDLWYDDFDITDNKQYQYYVTACWLDDPTMCSGASEIAIGYAIPVDTVSPPTEVPVNFTVGYEVSYDYIPITWNNGAETNATTVNIYRDGYIIDTMPFGSVEYRDRTANHGYDYEYMIAFANDDGEGPRTTEKTGRLSDIPEYVLVSDYEDSDVLNKIKNVDGHNSGLDADMLDGYHADHFSSTSHTHTCNDVGAPCGSWDWDDATATLYITIP
jgi:hypothetical protein